MAYAAAVSLLQNLKKLLRSDQRLIPYPKSQIESLHENVCFFKSFLKKKNLVITNSSATSLVHDFETQIIAAICEAEDIIESHISAHLFPSEFETSVGDDEIFSQKLLKVLQLFDSIKETTFKITINDDDRGREEPRTRSSHPFVLSRFLVGKKKFVGHEVDLMELRSQLIIRSSRVEVVGVVGMVGIGKTTLVNEVYNDPLVRQDFDLQAWVSVGPRNNEREILLSLLERGPNYSELSTEDLAICLNKMLKGKRYLIVFDDIRDIDTWMEVRRIFPNGHKGSRIIVTTRQIKVALYAADTREEVHHVRFLDEDESWDLLRYAAIGEDSCPPELVKIGKTIAKNCQRLSLKIIVLGSLLSHLSPDPKTWSTVADNPEIQNHEMLKVMQNSDHEKLPQHVKACFLYMTAFPLYQHIPVSKLLYLWIAEGFIEPTKSKTLEVVAQECFADLVDRSLIFVHKTSCKGVIITCSIHSAIWPFHQLEAVEHKIFQAIESYKDSASPSHRRFSIHRNILFSIKDVHNSIASVSTMRSLLCSGPYHSYLLRVMLNSRLLRVIDAVSIRFYEFPVEILKLVLLRYLALTLNRAELPTAVCNLSQLQFLIVRRHSSIIKSSCGTPCYLPMEIWNMRELRHLQVMGSDIPAPPLSNANALLPNLLTLSDVSAHSCTREVLGRIPNLEKLGIRIELGWDATAAAAAPLHVFDHLTHLNQLKTLKYVVMNPATHDIPSIQLPAAGSVISVLPPSLRKLTLCGSGFSWEYIRNLIGELPKLEVLKLRRNAFQGPEWEVNEDEFASLKYLLLQDLDIQHWKVEGFNFLALERLAVRHCYKLNEIPFDLGYIPTLETIDLVDCKPSAVDSAMRIQEQQKYLGNDFLRVCIHSAWTK